VTELLATTLETHMKGLRRYAVALLGDPIEAEDLVQDCCVKALSRAHVWPNVRDRRAYLFTILHNVFVDRCAQRRKRRDDIPIETMENYLWVPPSQEDRVEVQEFKLALKKLPESFKAVILLVGLEGMTYREAAAVLGIPIGTVMSRLARGREMLRYYMDGSGTGAPVTAPKSQHGSVSSVTRFRDRAERVEEVAAE